MDSNPTKQTSATDLLLPTPAVDNRLAVEDSMRRRSTGSAEEDDFGEAAVVENSLAEDGEKKRSFSSAKYNMTRRSDTLDRRKIERTKGRPPLLPNDSITPELQGLLKKHLQLNPDHNVNKMPEVFGKSHLRMRSPWSCSVLMLSSTVLATILLLSIVHSFLTRQVDSKGCGMCYTREIIYFKFADFDTEHTRFASKYSLHLIREQGYDEDPKVIFLFSYIPLYADSF